MNNCQICGARCTNDICNICKSQMETGDVNDIKQRVKQHDNRGYDAIKKICEFYHITDFDFFDGSRRQPAAQARKLYIYVAVRNLGFTNKKVSELLEVSKSYVSQQMAYWKVKLRKEAVRVKYEKILKLC